MTHVLALPAGTELVGDYRIERVLGAGGFGITYLAEEMALARDVTIKEYFPGDFAARTEGREAVPRSQDCAGDYQWGLDRFIEEAQTLARFDHRNIVRVYRYFRANNTGYMVLHFEEGQSLKSWLKNLRRAPRQKEIDQLLAPLLDALELIHKSDFLHRDIAPDNIIIRRDGTPVLIDFGSARGEIAQHSRTVSALVKPGYSPYEQYAETGKQQGPWTDIYALGATLYHAVTGKRPPDAPSRMVKDELVPAREVAISAYRPGFLAAIDRALQLDIDRRPQSVAEWRGALLAPAPARSGWLKRGADRNRERERAPDDKDRPHQRAAPAAAAAPPPPDAPAGKGRLLDYIDELRQRSAAKKKPTREEREAAGQPAPAEPAVATPAATVQVPAKPPPAPPLRRRKERPRPVREGPSRWRPLAVKLLIGAGIATAAVSFQDRIPRFDAGSASAPAAAHREGRDAGREGREARSSAREVREPSREAREGGREPREQPALQIAGHPGGALAVAWSEDGQWLVTVGADAKLNVWDAAAGGAVRSIALGHGPATSLAVLGRRALTGHGDGTIAVWDLERGERVGILRRNDAAIRSVAFAGDVNRIAAAGQDRSVVMWDARSGANPLYVLEGHTSTVHALAYSARGALLASGGAERGIRLWDGASTDTLRVYRGHRDFVSALAFSPDGRLLASAGMDGGIRLWSATSNRLLRALPGHRGRVTGLAFSPAGDQLASSGADGTLRLWDFRRSRLVRVLGDGGAAVRAVAYSPDGRRIATAADDGTVRLWEAGRPLAMQ